MSGHLNYVCGAPSSSRRLCFMGVAVLLGFAVLSPAADLPRTGTFSGVYHRDRWGVGRFHFYLVSPEKTKGTQLVSRKQKGCSSFRENKRDAARFGKRAASRLLPQVEDVNDDPPANDESAAVVMPGNHFYSYDAPGYTTLDASKIPGALNSDEQIYQLHAREFLRVQFDGTRPDGNGVEGSRCSDYQEWWSQISIVVNANGNITRTGAPHKSDIEPTPVFPRLGPPFAN